jgi:hypothetical protein
MVARSPACWRGASAELGRSQARARLVRGLDADPLLVVRGDEVGVHLGNYAVGSRRVYPMHSDSRRE